MKWAVAFLGLLLVLPAVAEVRVIDGDTLDVHGTRTRLWGIDAPEGKQSCQRDGVAWLCGQESARALRDYVQGKEVVCETRDVDRYKRSVSLCSVGGLSVNDWMVRQGWALDYRQYSKGAYADAEGEARDAKRGLWSGAFEKPWEWRRRQR